MKRKKELIIVLSSLLVIVLSVSVAYFATKILGEGKEISVESADLKVIFTSGSGKINGTDIEPGWTSGENTFTVKNESNGAYNYNIIIKDLVNTFVTEGFLVYKITSTDGGYNMTNFVDVPKSSTAADTSIAEGISIAKGATHTYTVVFKYLESTDVDQSADMGKKLSGKIFIEKAMPTLVGKLLEDNATISERTDFSTPFTTNTANTLYKATENGADVYYYAGADIIKEHCEYNGNVIESGDEETIITEELCLSEFTVCQIGPDLVYGLPIDCENDIGGTSITITNGSWISGVEKPINNWVKFGKHESDIIRYRGYFSTTDTLFKEYSTMKECTSDTAYNKNCTEYKYASAEDPMYWRIIRTNSDGSIRLLYSGTSTDTSDAFIGANPYNVNAGSSKYVGYMYGDSDSTLEEARTNTNDSTIKTYIDNWYENNLTSYTNYLSNDAVYCNDRELASGYNYSTKPSTSEQIYFKAYDRVNINKAPTYDCTNSKDAFSVNNAEAKLKYPVSLVSADEIAYAGGVYGQNAPMWYSTNSTYKSITGSSTWWLLSPIYWGGSSTLATNWQINGSDYYSSLGNSSVNYYNNAIRPVTSLKSCVQWKSGDGSASNPYEIVENGGC